MLAWSFPSIARRSTGGVVTIDGERIVAVETASQASGPVRDLGDVALLPAFVNAHTHLEFSHLRSPLGRPGMPLIEWLPLAIAERQNRSHTADESIALGVQESLLAGTCAIGEIATADAAAYETDAEVADRPVSGSDRLLAGTRSIGVRGGPRATGRSARVSNAVGLSPHAPYTVSPELLRQLVELAREERLARGNAPGGERARSSNYLPPAPDRFASCSKRAACGTRRRFPRAAVRSTTCGCWRDAPRALVIHGNYLVRDEHEFLAAHADRMTLVYCPRTHAYFAHPPYPLAELVALGVQRRAGNRQPGLESGPERARAKCAMSRARHADVPPDAHSQNGDAQRGSSPRLRTGVWQHHAGKARQSDGPALRRRIRSTKSLAGNSEPISCLAPRPRRFEPPADRRDYFRENLRISAQRFDRHGHLRPEDASVDAAGQSDRRRLGKLRHDRPADHRAQNRVQSAGASIRCNRAD